MSSLIFESFTALNSINDSKIKELIDASLTIWDAVNEALFFDISPLSLQHLEKIYPASSLHLRT